MSLRAFLCLATMLGILAQAAAQTDDQGATIRVEVNVVNLPVTVTDSEGRFIADLNKADFTVWEDGQQVEIRYFTRSVEEEKKPPLYVGFIIDLSNTARLYYKTYQSSIGDLAWMLVPEAGRNKGFLFGYHTEVDELVDFTNDPVTLTERMESLKHGGGSSMFDAIYRACTDKLVSIPYQGASEPRKVLVVIGDGHDNASKRSLDEVVHAAQLHQVTIYSVSTVGWGYHQAEETNLIRLARETGGRVVRPLQKVHKDVSGYLSKPQRFWTWPATSRASTSWGTCRAGRSRTRTSGRSMSSSVWPERMSKSTIGAAISRHSSASNPSSAAFRGWALSV